MWRTTGKCGVRQLVNARRITIGAATPRLLPMLSRSSPLSCHSSTLVITKMLARAVGLKVGCVAMSDTAHCVFPTLINGSARNGWCSSTRERYTRAGHNQVHGARTFLSRRICRLPYSKVPDFDKWILHALNGWCTSTSKRGTPAGHNQVHRVRNFCHLEEPYCFHINLIG